MENACRALLIQATKYSESSLILKLMTEEGAIKTCIARSITRKNSPTPAAVFQPLALLNLEIIQKGKPDSMHILKSASFAENPHIIYQNPIKQSILFFYAEVIQQLLKQDFQNEYNDLFQFITEKKSELETSSEVSAYLPLLFLLDMAQYAGVGIDPESYEEGYGFDISESKFIPEHHFRIKELFIEPSIASLLGQILIGESNPIGFTKSIRNELMQKIITYFRIHFNASFQLKSPEILSVVLS